MIESQYYPSDEFLDLYGFTPEQKSAFRMGISYTIGLLEREKFEKSQIEQKQTYDLRLRNVREAI